MIEQKPKSHFFRMGQLVRESGVSDQAIRYYEKLGLIEPSRRTSGGFRLFDAEVLQRLRAIRALQDSGFSLEEVGILLRGAKREDRSCEKLRGLVQAKVSSLYQEIATLRRRAVLVEKMIQRCDNCTDRCDWHDVMPHEPDQR